MKNLTDHCLFPKMLRTMMIAVLKMFNCGECGNNGGGGGGDCGSGS